MGGMPPHRALSLCVAVDTRLVSLYYLGLRPEMDNRLIPCVDHQDRRTQ